MSCYGLVLHNPVLCHISFLTYKITLPFKFLDGDLVANMPSEVTIDGRKEELAQHENILRTVGKLKLHHILSFITGATAQPGCGWPNKPSIEFSHGVNLSYPCANTCGLILTLPVTATNETLVGFFFTMAYSLCHGGMFSAI